MNEVKTFVSQIYRRKLFQWIINKTLLTLSLLLTVYLFWLIFNKFLLMTQAEWNILPLTLILSLVPFLFGKPDISGTIDFIEKQIEGLKGRLYLVMEPYPAALDSKAYTKRAVKECAAILKRKNIKKLTPIKIDFKHLISLVLIIIILAIFCIPSGGIKLKKISENPVITYADKKIKENQAALIVAKSTQLKRMYLLSNEGAEKMINFGDGKFGIMARIKKSSEIQVGYRTWKSKKAKLEVSPLLFITELELTYQFPDYLETNYFYDTLYDFEEEILIQALSGTQIHFSGVSNLILGDIKGEINNTSIKDENFSGSFILKEKGKISVNLTDSSLSSDYTLNFFIDPIKDEPPSIEFLFPVEEYRLGESMEVPLILQAEDDYALSSTSLIYAKEKIELPVPEKAKFMEDSLTLQVENLMPGETLQLNGIATDLAGNKTLSSPILIYMPTLEEIFSEYQVMNDTLKSYIANMEDREKEITDKIENFLYRSELGHKTQDEINKTLKEQRDLIEGMQKLAELTEEIRSPEISGEIDRIQELLNNSQVKDFLNNLNKMMEQRDISAENLNNLNTDQKDLLKTLELFKKSLEYLKKLLEMNELYSRAEEIYRKQKEITSQKADESSSELEMKLAEELERLIRDMEKEGEEEIKKIASEFKKTNTIEDMGSLADNMTKGEMNEKTIKTIEENLRNLNASLKNAIEQGRGGELTKAIKEKGWELGFILRTHNSIIDMKPGITKGLIEQGLMEALDRIDRELQIVFLKSLGFSPDVFTEIRRAKEKMKALSIELIQKKVPRASMERVNDSIILAILKLFSAPPPSSENLASALRGIIEQQNSIMNGLGKMMPFPLADPKASGDLKSLSAKQRKLAEDLKKMGKAFAPLSSEMEEMANNLERGRLDKNLIDRQRKVLDRLLEAEKAIREGEASSRRRSEPGIFVSPGKVSLPENLGEEKKNLRELLEKRINEPYPEEYKKEVEEYFKKLIE
ncbi:hypothetical protein JW879_05455 [candidate division WOR-3 bacterium]|nr:hypothetical protein [candidate division WOR-3 bacterium]